MNSATTWATIDDEVMNSVTRDCLEIDGFQFEESANQPHQNWVVGVGGGGKEKNSVQLGKARARGPPSTLRERRMGDSTEKWPSISPRRQLGTRPTDVRVVSRLSNDSSSTSANLRFAFYRFFLVLLL